jgi:hypothetical protein
MRKLGYTLRELTAVAVAAIMQQACEPSIIPAGMPGRGTEAGNSMRCAIFNRRLERCA